MSWWTPGMRHKDYCEFVYEPDQIVSIQAGQNAHSGVKFELGRVLYGQKVLVVGNLLIPLAGAV